MVKKNPDANQPPPDLPDPETLDAATGQAHQQDTATILESQVRLLRLLARIVADELRKEMNQPSDAAQP